MRKITVIAFVLAALALAACGPEDDEEEPGGPAIEITIATPVSLPLTPTNPAVDPAAAFDGAKLYVVYAQEDGTGSHDIVFAEQPVGGAFSSPVVVEATGGLDSRNPHCALDSTGTLHIVWEEATGTANREIHYATRTSAGVIVSQNLTATASEDEAGPRVYVDKSDRVHIVWESAGDIWYRRRTTSFQAAVMLPHTATGTIGNSADVTGDSQDRIYVTWVESIGVNQNLRILRANPGGSFAEVSTDGLAQRGSVIMSQPRLAGGASGQVFLAFIAQDSSGDRALAFCATVDGGATFSVPSIIYGADAPNIRDPYIAVRSRAGDTNLTIMLAINDGSTAGGNIQLYASRDSGLNFSGGAHNISAIDTTAGQNSAPVIALDDDSLAAAWIGKPAAGGVLRIMTSVSSYALPSE
ncbi:MAG: hypothetical protein IT462_05340 [Planctomycetes bacterium]|nr:hypothetical protein [Planctomycetota bacterium]